MKVKCYVYSGALILAVFIGVLYYLFFSSFSKLSTTQYVYITDKDDFNAVVEKLRPVANSHSLHSFSTLARHMGYVSHIRSGRYAITPGEGTLTVFRRFRNGAQSPVSLTIGEVRTTDRLAGMLSAKLMLDSAEIAHSLADNNFCSHYGYDTATIACLFVPNTYEVYWNISLDKLMERMGKEYDRFWDGERIAKANLLSLSPKEVATLASIVDEETANNAEKPMVAGMYYNRLMLRNSEYPNGMPLQADPTIKFAWKRFELRRIYNNLLNIKSPYNTYKNVGLPPGPIKVASVAGIDAVLNLVHHDYLYMCAKEDFSGTHNFARTYSEHLSNAARYAKALNERGIK